MGERNCLSSRAVGEPTVGVVIRSYQRVLDKWRGAGSSQSRDREARAVPLAVSVGRKSHWQTVGGKLKFSLNQT